MAMNAPAWILSQAFTKETADEFGAVKGAPCTVGDVSYDADGNTVVELVWTNSAGVSKTTEMKVNAGVGIKSAAINASGHLILTRTDDTTLDAGEIPLPDMSDYAKKTEIPTKVEDLDDAADYAKKSEIPEGSVVDDALSETSKNPVQNKIVTAELKKKVDAEDGKGLSTNDYDDTSKAKVDAIPSDPKYTDTVYDDTEIKKDIAKKVDAVDGKGLSTNDYDTAAKTKVDAIPEDPKYTDTVYDDTEIKKDIAKKIDIQQKAEDKGKALVVGEDGKVVPTKIPTDTSMVEKAIADNWGGNGYNLIPFPYYDSNVANRNGIDWSVDDNGIIYATGTSTASRFNLHTRSKGELNDWTLENGDYYFYVETNCTDNRITVQFQITKNDTYYTLANVLNGGAKVEINGDDHYTDKVSPQVQIYIPNGVIVDNVYFKIMLLKYNPNGTYPTEYQRFASGNVELTNEISRKELELAELKVLGWTVPKDCKIQNEINGNRLIQKVGRVDLGTLNYTKYDVAQGILFRTPLRDNMKSFDNYDVATAYTNGYVTTSSNARTEKSVSITSSGLDLINSDYTDANAFKVAMQGQYLYYELATYKNITIDGSEIANQFMDMKMLGWSVPAESPIKNSVNGNTFIQRVGRVDLGELNWGINAYATPTAFSLHENIDLPDLVSVSDNKDEKVRCYSPNYDSDSASKVTGTTRTYTFCVITGKRLYVRANVTTAEELKTELSDKYIYYELETPIVKQIDGNEVIEKDAVTAKVNNFVKPTSDAEILALSNGIYSINVDDTSLFPNRWGTLIVLKSGYVYGSMIFIGADARYWFRNTNSGAWRETAWKELATMDKVAEEDGTASFNISLAVDRNELSKVGKVVTFNALFGSTSGLSTKNTTFATIPEGFRPKTEKRLVGCIGETFQEFSIGTDGTIKCITSSIPGGATICAFNGSWLTD